MSLSAVIFGLTGQQIAQAGLTTAVGLIVGVLGFLLNRKAHQIHVLVNSQMTQALKRISDLEKALGINAGGKIPVTAVVTHTPDPADESVATLVLPVHVGVGTIIPPQPTEEGTK